MWKNARNCENNMKITTGILICKHKYIFEPLFIYERETDMTERDRQIVRQRQRKAERQRERE